MDRASTREPNEKAQRRSRKPKNPTEVAVRG